MAVRAKIGGGKEQETISFNDIIGHVPGRPGRDPAKKGMYQNVKNGNILVVFGTNPMFVEYEKLRNGKRGNRTGFTRAGMMLIEKATGAARPLTCDKNPDGAKNWRLYEGSIELAGNPHVVNRDDEDEVADLD